MKSLDKAEAIKYLSLYLGEQDWDSAIKNLATTLTKKGLNKKSLWLQAYKQVGYCLMNPGRNLSSPVGYFIACGGFADFEDRDWTKDLKRIWEEDQHIAKMRKIIAAKGMIADKELQFYPHARAALEDMKALGSNTDEDHIKKLKALIRIWGALVFRISLRQHEERLKENVLSWNHWYHIERGVVKLHKWTDLLRFKQLDLEEMPRELIRR